MPRNIEIKAQIDDWDSVRSCIVSLATSGPTVIAQEDVFFHCEHGRLKLRLLGESHGELIHYDRADDAGPKTSTYSIARTSVPAALLEVLAAALGVRAVVRKERTLWRLGRTRIHLDQVESLGSFLELEVVMADGEDPSAGIEEAHELIRSLGISQSQLVQGAYVDLLERNATS